MNDPYQILDVSTSSDDEAIRAAYLSAVRACPPERDAARFEQIRKAYESIATRRDRAIHALFDTRAPTATDALRMMSAQWQPAHPNLRQLLDILQGK